MNINGTASLCLEAGARNPGQPLSDPLQKFRLDAVHRLAKDPRLGDNVAGERRRDEDWDTMPERLRGIRRCEYPGDRGMPGDRARFDRGRFPTTP